MATATRIYRVTVTVKTADKEIVNTTLVRAATAAQATHHATKDMAVAVIPSQDELIDLTNRGVKVQTVGAESATSSTGGAA